MKSKHLLTLLGALCVAPAALALEPKVVVESSDQGSSQEAQLSVDTKIMVTDGGIQIVNGAQELKVPYSAIEKIRFVTTPSSLTSVSDSARAYSLRANPVGASLEIAGFSGRPASLAIVGLNGSLLHAVSRWTGEPVDVAHLAPGVYLVKIDNETLKFIKQ